MLRCPVIILIALVLGCAGPGAAQLPAANDASNPAPEVRKTIIVAAGAPVKGFVSWNQPTTAGGTLGLNEIYANGLSSTDAVGKREGLLAARIPSLEDGSMVVLPDGHMRATWPLRPNVKWQDGAPFSAEDVVFGWQVAMDPGTAKASRSSTASLQAQMESVEAPDPLTVVVTWKVPFSRALDLDLEGLWPLPKHLLGEAFAGDAEAFRHQPYFTTEFVHLGPFRLVDFGLGENLVFERFDDYYRGKPKVDRIVARIITDPNTLIANLLSGAIDIAVPSTLPYQLITELRAEWARTGDGAVVERPDGSGFRSLITQMRPEYARPVELARDVRVRRALFLGLDRHALGESLLPGATNIVVTSFLDPSDARGAVVGEAFARYPYDPTRAAQEFAGLQWRRDGAGRLVNADGEGVQLVVRTTGGSNSAREMAIIANFWRQLGIDAVEELLPEAQATNLEVRAKFSGFETTSVGGGDDTLRRWDSRIAPSSETRWAGNNRGGYINPALDQIIDTVRATVDEREQARLLKEGAEIIATDLPAIPLYRDISAAVVRKGVRALFDDFAGVANNTGSLSRNAHLWDRE